MSITLDPPWLEFDLGQPMQVLSWAPYGAGFRQTTQILWRQVRNADLPPELDVECWLADALATKGKGDCVCMLTSRDVATHHVAQASIMGVTAVAVATVGLSNAERVGQRVDRSGRDWDRDLHIAPIPKPLGTINIGLRIDTGLSQTGLLEAMSIATQARTTAILDSAHHLPCGQGLATGTGTDCIAVAAPNGTANYAGLHTEIGEAIGRAVMTAVSNGAREWQATIGQISDG